MPKLSFLSRRPVQIVAIFLLLLQPTDAQTCGGVMCGTGNSACVSYSVIRNGTTYTQTFWGEFSCGLAALSYVNPLYRAAPRLFSAVNTVTGLTYLPLSQNLAQPFPNISQVNAGTSYAPNVAIWTANSARQLTAYSCVHVVISPTSGSVYIDITDATFAVTHDEAAGTYTAGNPPYALYGYGKGCTGATAVSAMTGRTDLTMGYANVNLSGTAFMVSGTVAACNGAASCVCSYTGAPSPTVVCPNWSLWTNGGGGAILYSAATQSLVTLADGACGGWTPSPNSNQIQLDGTVVGMAPAICGGIPCGMLGSSCMTVPVLRQGVTTNQTFWVSAAELTYLPLTQQTTRPFPSLASVNAGTAFAPNTASWAHNGGPVLTAYSCVRVIISGTTGAVSVVVADSTFALSQDQSVGTYTGGAVNTAYSTSYGCTGSGVTYQALIAGTTYTKAGYANVNLSGTAFGVGVAATTCGGATNCTCSCTCNGPIVACPGFSLWTSSGAGVVQHTLLAQSMVLRSDGNCGGWSMSPNTQLLQLDGSVVFPAATPACGGAICGTVGSSCWNVQVTRNGTLYNQTLWLSSSGQPYLPLAQTTAIPFPTIATVNAGTAYAPNTAIWTVSGARQMTAYSCVAIVIGTGGAVYVNVADASFALIHDETAGTYTIGTVSAQYGVGKACSGATAVTALTGRTDLTMGYANVNLSGTPFMVSGSVAACNGAASCTCSYTGASSPTVVCPYWSLWTNGGGGAVLYTPSTQSLVTLADGNCGGFLPSPNSNQILLDGLVIPTPSQTQSATLTQTPSQTQTVTQTGTLTQSPSETATQTQSGSVTLTASQSVTQTPSQTQSPTQTGSPSESQSGSQIGTQTGTPSQATSKSPTLTPSQSATPSESQTRTQVVSASQTPSTTQSTTQTQTLSETPSVTQAPSFSQTLTSSVTTTLSASGAATPSASPSGSQATTPSASQTRSQAATVTETPTITTSVVLTATPTSSSTSSQTSSPTLTGSQAASSSVSQAVTPSPTATQSMSASQLGTPTGTQTASSSGSSLPTPTGSSTGSQTSSPTVTGSQAASSSASQAATASPSSTLSPSATQAATTTETPSVTTSFVLTSTPTGSGTSSQTGTLTSTSSQATSVAASVPTTASATTSPTVTQSLSVTQGATPSSTPSGTSSGSPASTPTSSSTMSEMSSSSTTGSQIATSSASQAATATESPTVTTSFVLTATPTTSSTGSQTSSSTITSSQAASSSASQATSSSQSQTRSVAPPTQSASPSQSETISSTASPPTAVPATLTATGTTSPQGSSSLTQSISPSSSQQSTPTQALSSGSSPSQTGSSAPTPSASASLTSSQPPTLTSTGSATRSVSQTSSASPSLTTSQAPTSSPSSSPSRSGTPTRSTSPTLTVSPSPSPTGSPSASPSQSRSQVQTGSQSPSFGSSRSQAPTASPTQSTSATFTPTLTSSSSQAGTPTPSASASQTSTSTGSPTGSVSPSESWTRSTSQSRSQLASPSTSFTASQTFSTTLSLSQSPTETESSTQTQTASGSTSPTQTVTTGLTPTATPSQTSSQVPTPTSTTSPTRSSSQTSSPSQSETDTQTLTTSPSATPSRTRTPTATGSSTPSGTQSPTWTSSVTTTPSQSHSQAPSGSQTPSFGSSPSQGSTVTQTPSLSRTASSTPTSSLTPSVSSTASGTPSSTASAAATASGSPTPSLTLSQTRTRLPSSSRTASQTASPSQSTSGSPSGSPSESSSPGCPAIDVPITLTFFGGGITPASAAANGVLLRLAVSCYLGVPLGGVTLASASNTTSAVDLSPGDPANTGAGECALLSGRAARALRRPAEESAGAAPGAVLPDAAQSRGLDSGDATIVSLVVLVEACSVVVSSGVPALPPTVAELLQDLGAPGGPSPLSSSALRLGAFMAAAARMSGDSPSPYAVSVGQAWLVGSASPHAAPAAAGSAPSSGGSGAGFPVISVAVSCTVVALAAVVGVFVWLACRRNRKRGATPPDAKASGEADKIAGVNPMRAARAPGPDSPVRGGGPAAVRLGSGAAAASSGAAAAGTTLQSNPMRQGAAGAAAAQQRARAGATTAMVAVRATTPRVRVLPRGFQGAAASSSRVIGDPAAGGAALLMTSNPMMMPGVGAGTGSGGGGGSGSPQHGLLLASVATYASASHSRSRRAFAASMVAAHTAAEEDPVAAAWETRSPLHLGQGSAGRVRARAAAAGGGSNSGSSGGGSCGVSPLHAAVRAAPSASSVSAVSREAAGSC